MNKAHHGRKTRLVMTTAGELKLSRIYFCCVKCGDGGYAADGRLGVFDTSAITVLADGAKWIWEEQLNHLRGAEGVLDIFHALEHIAV